MSLKAKLDVDLENMHPNKRKIFEMAMKEPTKSIHIEVPDSLFSKLESYLIKNNIKRTKWFIGLLQSLDN